MNIPATISGRPVTNRGVHLHPFGFHDFWMQRADYWVQLLVDMGMSWVVVLTEGDALYISGAAEALLQGGVVPIVRPHYQFPEHFSAQDAVAQLANLYARYNAPLIVQFGNEPFDRREWRNQQVPGYEQAWQIIVDRWHEAAQLIVERGAIAGFPDGPGYGENPFLRIGDDAHHWQDGKAAYLGHHYGKGRPGNFPRDDVSRLGTQLTMAEYREALDDYADEANWNEGSYALSLMNAQRRDWADPNASPLTDDTCWRGWEKVQLYSRQAFGFEVPMAMTEGGWVPRDRAGSNPADIRWPYTTPRMVAKKTLEMYNTPSPHFAKCPWLLADGDMAGGDVGWPFDAWHSWAYFAKYGQRKPVVQTLIANPPVGNIGGELVEQLSGLEQTLAAARNLLEA
jgi:hypothetical protein